MMKGLIYVSQHLTGIQAMPQSFLQPEPQNLPLCLIPTTMAKKGSILFNIECW